MIWLVNFPLPPSVNDYLMPVVPRRKREAFPQFDSKGPKARLVKTEVHRKFMDLCYLWRAQNNRSVWAIQSKLKALKEQKEAEGRPFALRVDAFFVFHVEQRLAANDANNRLKPVLDGLVNILEIDDRYFFSGLCEKVSTKDKDKECSILRISPMIPRTLEDIRELMAREMSTAGS